MQESIYQEIEDRFGEADCIFAFGELDRAQGKWQAATKKFHKAFIFYKESGLPYEQAMVLWQLGMAAYGTKKQEAAIEYLNQALQILKTIENPRAKDVQKILVSVDEGIFIDPKEQFNY